MEFETQVELKIDTEAFTKRVIRVFEPENELDLKAKVEETIQQIQREGVTFKTDWGYRHICPNYIRAIDYQL